MTASRAWDAIWLTVFPLVLAGGSAALLPHNPVIQGAFLPLWCVYWMLTRGPRMGVWVALWCGVLLEVIWGVPPGGCALFFVFVWRILRLLRARFPDAEALTPLHGLLLGTVLVPLLRLWLWLYAVLWLGASSASGLTPSLVALIVAPAIGAVGGGAVFTLARLWDFRALRPPKKEVESDEG